MLLASACGEGPLPCADCPPVAGAYALHWQEAPGEDPCVQSGGLLPAELELTQDAAALRATVDGTELSGTLYETLDFTLRGVGAPDGGVEDVIQVRGRYVRGPGGSADAGQLFGTFGRERLVEGAFCTTQRDFQGQRLR